jgi:hypothetical protein
MRHLRTQEDAHTALGIRAPSRPEYCLDDTFSWQELIEQVLLQAERTPAKEDVGASALLYGTLSRFRKCQW